jgi:hypothetical protein
VRHLELDLAHAETHPDSGTLEQSPQLSINRHIGEARIYAKIELLEDSMLGLS